MLPCPICGLEGGFHDHSKHAENEVPRHLLKESGWAKKAHEELKLEKALREVERQSQIDTIAAELDDDKQAMVDILDENGKATGERILVMGIKKTA